MIVQRLVPIVPSSRPFAAPRKALPESLAEVVPRPTTFVRTMPALVKNESALGSERKRSEALMLVVVNAQVREKPELS